MSLIDAGREVLGALRSAGHEAYFVGGFVRDHVLGRETKDIDIATSAQPAEVMAVFARSIPTGLQHGTVTVVTAEGHTFEVTTFRTESGYDDFRRPSKVTFVRSLAEDLRRRDFTINAMAMDESGDLIDPYGGREDLKQGLLRCVGEPEERFREDALRMLRCIRFASEYGLAIEERTWSALLGQASLLRHIAMERIRAELERIVEGERPTRGLLLLQDSELLHHGKKPIALPLSRYTPAADARDDEGKLSIRLERLREEPVLRWAWLFTCLESGIGASRLWMKRLTFSTSKIDAVGGILAVGETLLNQINDLVVSEDAALRRLLITTAIEKGWEHAYNWTSMASVYALFLPNNELKRLAVLGRKWLEKMEVRDLSDLIVTGRDLIQEIGFPEGPLVGQALNKLLLGTAAGEYANDRDTLLDIARTMLK